jgi:hypothetical protein
MGGDNSMPSERNSFGNKKNSIKADDLMIYEPIYKTIFWLDENIDNQENLYHQKFFKNKIGIFSLKTFNNIKDFFAIAKTIKFQIVFVVVSGRLYTDYYFELKKLKNEITSIFLSIIFTSVEYEKILLSKKNDIKYNIKEEVFNSIGDNYYNYGGVTSNKESVINFVRTFLGIKSKVALDYSNALTFEIIEDNNMKQIIFPSLYANIEMADNSIEDEDIEEFNNYLIKNHDYRGISELITIYRKIGNIPLEILIKYWIRYYSSESSFYSTMNVNLMKKNNYENYEIFVKALYKGIEKGFLKSKHDIELYRCQLISKNEYDILEKALNNKKRVQIYSRTFLSFSIKEKKAEGFLQKVSEKSKLIPIKLIIRPKIEGEIFSSNANIKEFSIYSDEEEILFFPLSSFIIDEKIEEKIIRGINTKIIYLNYLGKYEKEIKLMISETFDKNIDIDEIIGVNQNRKFTIDVLNKKMKPKFQKNLDDIKLIVEKEMKNILNSKKKKNCTFDDDNKFYTVGY